MKNKYLIFLNFSMLLLLLGQIYTKGVYVPKFDGTDKRFQSYLNEISRLSKGKITEEKLKGIDIGFSKFSKNTEDKKFIGFCHIGPGFKEIEIDEEFWEVNTFESKMLLLLHEIGHCYCNLDHDDKKKNDNCPESTMSSAQPNDECVKKHYNSYLEEIFDKC